MKILIFPLSWLVPLVLCLLSPISYANCIGVVTAGGGAGFWQEVRQGAQQAAKDLNIQVIVRGPIDEANSKGQSSVIKSIIKWGCKGLVLAPNSKDRKKDVKSLKEKGIPTVYIDRDVGGDRISVIKTQNYQAGILAGIQMSKALKGQGRVALLRMSEDVVTTTHRENGFINAAVGGGLEVIYEGYIGTTIGNARKNAIDILSTLEKLDGIFTPNESTTLSTIKALQKLPQHANALHIGFDTHNLIIESLLDKSMYGFIAQKPFLMGYQGVETVHQAMQGISTQRLINTDTTFVNIDNIQLPSIKILLGID